MKKNILNKQLNDEIVHSIMEIEGLSEDVTRKKLSELKESDSIYIDYIQGVTEKGYVFGDSSFATEAKYLHEKYSLSPMDAYNMLKTTLKSPNFLIKLFNENSIQK